MLMSKIIFPSLKWKIILEIELEKDGDVEGNGMQCAPLKHTYRRVNEHGKADDRCRSRETHKQETDSES
jgi:hypothetical protein